MMKEKSELRSIAFALIETQKARRNCIHGRFSSALATEREKSKVHGNDDDNNPIHRLRLGVAVGIF